MIIKKTMPIYYSFNKNNAFIMYSQNITPLSDIIIPSGYIITKNYIYQALKLLKKLIKKLLSKIAFHVSKKTKMIYYVFNQKVIFFIYFYDNVIGVYNYH